MEECEHCKEGAKILYHCEDGALCETCYLYRKLIIEGLDEVAKITDPIEKVAAEEKLTKLRLAFSRRKS